jgi:hypothetical protein
VDHQHNTYLLGPSDRKRRIILAFIAFGVLPAVGMRIGVNVGVTGAFDGLRVGDNGVSAQCPSFTPSSRFDDSGLIADARQLVDKRPIAVASVPTLRLHEASSGTGQWEDEDENPHLGRWPEERFGVRGLCDATPCPVTDLRVVSSSFAGFGRSSATLGHLRRAVFHATTFRDSGLSLRATPIFYSSPAFGVDAEPGDSRSAIRVLDRLGQRGRLLSGQLNFVHSHFRNDRGGAFRFNSKAGVYEQISILHSDVLVAPGLEPPDTFGALAYSANWDSDFVCNRFRIGEGRNLQGWSHGGSGVFSRNLVTGEGDVTLGRANSGCREPGYTTALESDIAADFCEDINVRLPLIDLNWRVPGTLEDEAQGEAVPFAETQMRVVTDNTLVIGEYAYWGGLNCDTWRVEGDELEINADWVQNNTVCFHRHEYARDPAYLPGVTFGLPWLRGAAHGMTVVNGDLSLVDGTDYSCVQSAALTAAPVPANFPSPYGDVCSEADDREGCLRAWFAGTCQENAAASALFPWDDLAPLSSALADWSAIDVASAYDALLASSSASWGSDLWPTGGLRIPGAAAAPAANYRSLAVPDELANVSAHWFARPRPPEACSPSGGIVDNAGCPPDSPCRAVSDSVSSHSCMRSCNTHDDCPREGLCLDSPEPALPST